MVSQPRHGPKQNSNWRMCVDFTDLNKAYTNDCYPLPRIDAPVDSATGNEILCLLDAFKGYHQIGVSHEDQDKTAFITNRGVYYYITMPFGLKNVGAIYHRLVNKIFHNQLGRYMEAYIDDLQIKNQVVENFIPDLKEVFEAL